MTGAYRPADDGNRDDEIEHRVRVSAVDALCGLVASLKVNPDLAQGLPSITVPMSTRGGLWPSSTDDCSGSSHTPPASLLKGDTLSVPQMIAVVHQLLQALRSKVPSSSCSSNCSNAGKTKPARTPRKTRHQPRQCASQIENEETVDGCKDNLLASPVDELQQQYSHLQIFDATDPAFQPPADFLELSEAELRMRGVYLVESHLCIKRLMGSRPSEVMSLLGTGVALKGILEDLDAAFPATATIYVATQASLERVMGYQNKLEAALTLEDPKLLVVMENLGNPDNVGGIFRTALGFGADAVITSSGCADPFYRKSIRSSMGASLCLPSCRALEWPLELQQLRQAGFTVVGLALTPWAVELSSIMIDEAQPRKFAVLVGAEGPGLTAAALEHCDIVAKISMTSAVDSLNVGVAAALAIHHFSSVSNVNRLRVL